MEERKNLQRELCQFCGFVKQNEDCSCCISSKNTVKEACMYWRFKLNEMSKIIKLFCDELLIRCLTSQIEGFIARLFSMENMLCNADRLQRAEMEKLAFEQVKDMEKIIIKSLSYRKYCKIKDLISMFDKAQPVIPYNKDPRDDFNHWKDIIKEDVKVTISKLQIEHRETVLKLNNSITNLNLNINSLISESEIKKNRWKSIKQEYKQQIEELTSQVKELNIKRKRTKDHKKELQQKYEDLNKAKENLESKYNKLNQKEGNLKEELSNLQTEYEVLSEIVKQHSKETKDKAKEVEVLEINKTNKEYKQERLKRNNNDNEIDLVQKTKENEDLNTKIQLMKVGANDELEELINCILDNKDSFKRLSKRLNKFLEEFLENSAVYEAKYSNFVNYSAFNYFFNTDIEVQICTEISRQGNKIICVGFKNKRNNFQIGASMWIFDNGEMYQGYFKQNIGEFYGRNFYPNGDFYEGGWRQDRYHGYGKHLFKNGCGYVGEWADGRMNGQGEYQYIDGSRYVGNFKDSKRYGLGELLFTNGDRYIGEFEDDKCHGKGEIKYSDGSTF